MNYLLIRLKKYLLDLIASISTEDNEYKVEVHQESIDAIAWSLGVPFITVDNDTEGKT